MKLFKLSSLTVLALGLLQSVYALDSVTLHAIEVHPYTLTFSGTVKAGSAPVADQLVQLRLHTSKNTVLETSGRTLIDGSYRMEVSLDEYRNEMVDWTLDAGKEDSVVDGRCILGDNTEIALEKALQAKAVPPVLVALR